MDTRHSVVSQQLRILWLREMVTAQRDGAFSRYRIASKDVRDLLQKLQASPYLERLGRGGTR